MKLAPPSWKRPVLLMVLGAVLILGWLKLTWWKYPRHVHDEAHILDRELEFAVNKAYADFTKSAGVDVRILTIRSLREASLEKLALNRMRTLKVGATTDRRGLLVILDVESKQARLEVGPNLEGLFTDAYASYVARDVLAPMLQNETSPGRILSSLLHMLLFRVDQGLLGEEWDPAILTAIRERQRLALGGGADAVATLADANRLGAQPAPAALKPYYTAQPTAAQALERTLDWLQEPFAYHDVNLLSGASQFILTQVNNDMSVGNWRFDQVSLSKERFLLVERGTRAIAIPTVSPLTHPIWLLRGPDGWQYELTPEFATLWNVGPGPWRWLIIGENDPWIRELKDVLEPMPYEASYRFRDGNNTPIPGRDSYR